MSSNLIRQTLQEIGKLERPMVILIDATGEVSSRLNRSLKDTLWNEMHWTFKNVQHAALYSLESDIRNYLGDEEDRGPIVLEMEKDDLFQPTAKEVLFDRLSSSGIKNVMVLYLTGTNWSVDEEWIHAQLARERMKNPQMTITPWVIGTIKKRR